MPSNERPSGASRILLTTLNARYIHAALGLRYLMANMGELEPVTRIVELTIQNRPTDIAERLLGADPAIIGFGVYIWNLTQTTEVVAVLKRLRGTPITRHTETYRMVYQPFPPYTVLSTSLLDFPTLQRLGRFARYWDLVINSGRFGSCRTLRLADKPFARFLQRLALRPHRPDSPNQPGAPPGAGEPRADRAVCSGPGRGSRGSMG